MFSSILMNSIALGVFTKKLLSYTGKEMRACQCGTQINRDNLRKNMYCIS
jgi:hypothetical protein